MSKNGSPFLYIIGVPGAGKTTTLNMALRGSTSTQMKEPVPHILHVWDRRPKTSPMLFEIGVRRPGGFSGTDGLGYAAQAGVIEWLLAAQPGPIVAEGDRLANDRFLRAVQDADYDLSIVLLDASDELAEERRRKRGSNQNASWLKGRATKVLNLAHRWEKYVTVIDAAQSLVDAALQLREQAVFADVRALTEERRHGR